MSVTVRPTDEKSLSDCAELADMQRMRLEIPERFLSRRWAASLRRPELSLLCILPSLVAWKRCEPVPVPTQAKTNSATGTHFYISSLYTENDLYCPRNRDRLKGRHLTDRCCCWATEANCLIILWSIEPTTSRLHWRARTAQKDVGRIGHKAGRESQAWLFV